MADHFRQFRDALREQVAVVESFQPRERFVGASLELDHREQRGDLFFGNANEIVERTLRGVESFLLHLVDQGQGVMPRPFPTSFIRIEKRNSKVGEQSVVDLPVVHPDDEFTDTQLRKDAVDDRGHLRVVQQTEILVADHVDIALVELAEPAFLGPFATPDFLDLEAAEREVELPVILRDVPCERNREIEVEREVFLHVLVLLVRDQVDAVDLLSVLPCFAEEDILAFDGRRLDGREPEQLVVLGDDALHALEDDLLLRQELSEPGNGRCGN